MLPYKYRCIDKIAEKNLKKMCTAILISLRQKTAQ